MKCKCVFSLWSIHDLVACLSSVYFNLSSLLSVSSHMLGLILHCHLSLCIHVLECPSLFPSPLCLLSSLCHVLFLEFSDCTGRFCFLSLLSYFSRRFCYICVSNFHCFLLLLSMSFSLSHCFWLLFLHLYSLILSVFLRLGRLQQQTPGGLLVSNGETLRSEGLLASKRVSQHYTKRVMTGT